jgi:hypothetical protein
VALALVTSWVVSGSWDWAGGFVSVPVNQLVFDDAVVGVADDQLTVMAVCERQVGDPAGVLEGLA